MAAYDILDTYWYTPTSPGQDPLQDAIMGLPSVAVVFVAIKSGDNWKCYMGWVPTEMDPLPATMLVAGNGCKVNVRVAKAHFPTLAGNSDQFGECIA